MMDCIKQNGYALAVNAVFARKYCVVCFILNIFLRIERLFHAMLFFLPQNNKYKNIKTF